ncbi:DNA/RNA non-specific endonuclease [Bradyrhizobium sp.]|uniref:DNA/RNA non-specific endonuclease n=1 Tax=Bradyrhizobium sp. TaxID=376 RepID=UPI001DF3441F|nr:DNA/RNA non-specific endonuclease [Bradyrhizobium sp.]MBI5319171.1 DNA/RNA non-specific endonuclease [Bradyrhizobium sp.]
MPEDVDQIIEGLARARIAKNKKQIQNSLKQISAGNPLGAEPEEDRRVERITRKTGLSVQDCTAISDMISKTANQVERKRGGAEAVIGPTIDFVGVEFLSRGRLAANAVGRVRFRSGRAQGTGFLVGPGIFLTNNHVITTAEQAGQMFVEFDFEADDAGSNRPITVFTLDPGRCFASDPIRQLDFTLIAIGERVSGTKTIDRFGYIPLSDATDKHMLGEIANIIQHPQGRLKQIVVRENNLVSRDETNQVLHYLADTDHGSSGSPVCNNDWDPIALHHWGGPGLEIKGTDGRPLPQEINEGIRISAIVRALRGRVAGLEPATSQAVARLLAMWDGVQRPGPIRPESTVPAGGEALGRSDQPRINGDGSMTWTFPVEISVRAPLASPAAANLVTPQPPASLPPPAAPIAGAERASVDFSDRGGYEPGFIRGFNVPLPSFDSVPYNLAVNREAGRGEDRHELRYHHFSIFMNADRKLAALTACNVDGSRLFAINRRTKEVKKASRPSDMDLESMGGAESSDDFQSDPRVEDDQMGVEFYSDQEVPGFPKPVSPGRDAPKSKKSAFAKASMKRTARMFQKGHLTLRSDPAWGTEDQAVAAEADTFFYTNAVPQLGFFNQGSPDNAPGVKGKLRWRALETYVLRNALTMRQRVCIFAGCVFDDRNDIPYRQDSKVPVRFWKIAIWAEDDELHAIAVIANQKPVLDKLTKGVPEGAELAEAFGDPEELSRVSEFLTTVAEIERLTKLDFGKQVRDADVRAGQEGLSPAIDADESVLKRPRRRNSGRRGSARKRTVRRASKKRK